MSDPREQPEPPPDAPAPAEAVPPPPPHLEGWDEDLYQATAAVLVEPERARSAWLGVGCLIVSVVLFALSIAYYDRLATLAFILPVLFLHEAGHFVGMRLFGYRNVRMFFIPFFGAAVSGRKHAAPAWQQVVVLLLGPLPGLALALALQVTARPSQDIWLGDLIVWLVVLNGLNLLPIVPLDGGRVVDVLFFARRPWPAVALRVLAAGALMAAAYLTWGLTTRFESGVLALMGALVLAGAPLQFRRARLQRAFGHNPLALPGRLEEIGDAQRRELFGWAALLHPLDRDPISLAADMRNLHEQMVSRRPGTVASLALLGLYLAGFAAAFGALWLSASDTRERRDAQIAALIASFDRTAVVVHELREASPKTPPARLAALREERSTRWEGLLAEWRRAPVKVRQQALNALHHRAEEEMRAREPRGWAGQKIVSELARDLGMRPGSGPGS